MLLLLLLFHSIPFWAIGPRPGLAPPPGAAFLRHPGGPSPVSYFKRALPPRLWEGPSVVIGGEMGGQPRGSAPTPFPDHLKERVGGRSGGNFPRR